MKWSTENIVLFGKWLTEKQNEHGYGLLCIHGACLGIKIGSLLKLKWSDFIDVANNECKSTLIIKDEKKTKRQIIELSNYVRRYTEWAFMNDYWDLDRDIDGPIYINLKTNKLLTTSTLNRELNRFYDKFKLEILEQSDLEITLEPIKTNFFEIAWARDMVKKYNYTKKIFIEVSKYLGHRTVNDTINLIGIEPNDEIKITHDLYNPSTKREKELDLILSDKNKLVEYLFAEKIGLVTEKYLESKNLEPSEEINDLFKEVKVELKEIRDKMNIPKIK
jgi:hypothetical protein